MATPSEDLLQRYRSGEFLAHLTAKPAPGLGDCVASALDAVGITKERVSAVAAAVGIADCGCDNRQAWLNRVGHAVGIGTPNPHKTADTDFPDPR
jgi:hypothetical protein